MSKDWIQTFTGQKFFPLDPTPESIHIVDIAHALSHVCRFTGHVQRFYTVAEHSIRVGRRIWDLLDRVDSGWDLQTIKHLATWGLLHDASEAYIADVSRPLKHQPAMAEYRAAESKLQHMIAERFGLVSEEPEIVRRADNELLAAEAHALMSPLHPDWGATMPNGRVEVEPEIAWLVNHGEIGSISRRPSEARALFLETYCAWWGRP